MATDTLTLVLHGRVSLTQFARATARFHSLVAALSAQVGGRSRIEWEVVDLQPSDTRTTVIGIAPAREPLDAVVRAYEIVGESLGQAAPIPYDRRVQAPAQALADLLNGRISSITFETANKDVTVVSERLRGNAPPQLSAHGMVEGRVQTLTSRAGLRFTLYDRAFDAAVSCYVEQGKEDLLRDIWGKPAAVEGWVTRDRESGRPLSVRRIQHIGVLPEAAPGHYTRARGASPRAEEEPDATTVIRKLRDAWRG